MRCGKVGENAFATGGAVTPASPEGSVPGRCRALLTLWATPRCSQPCHLSMMPRSGTVQPEAADDFILRRRRKISASFRLPASVAIKAEGSGRLIHLFGRVALAFFSCLRCRSCVPVLQVLRIHCMCCCNSIGAVMMTLLHTRWLSPGTLYFRLRDTVLLSRRFGPGLRHHRPLRWYAQPHPRRRRRRLGRSAQPGLAPAHVRRDRPAPRRRLILPLESHP